MQFKGADYQLGRQGFNQTKVITDTQYMTDHLKVRPWPLALRHSNILFEVIKDTQYMTDHLMVRPWPLALRHSNILFKVIKNTQYMTDHLSGPHLYLK